MRKRKPSGMWNLWVFYAVISILQFISEIATKEMLGHAPTNLFQMKLLLWITE
jgi:hypothetical protein